MPYLPHLLPDESRERSGFNSQLIAQGGDKRDLPREFEVRVAGVIDGHRELDNRLAAIVRALQCFGGW